MKPQVGDSDFPIWLLGDSNPKGWQSVLETPLDPRHPARHNIWTPVLEVIQDNVFREQRCRVDGSRLYIRNAIGDPSIKPESKSVEWSGAVTEQIAALKELLAQHSPPILLCFGAFAFEFARRTLEENPERPHIHWGARNLGGEFRRRMQDFDVRKTNAFPLLHASIARGKFIQSHDYFCGSAGANYFVHVGDYLAGTLLQHRNSLRVWIE